MVTEITREDGSTSLAFSVPMQIRTPSKTWKFHGLVNTGAKSASMLIQDSFAQEISETSGLPLLPLRKPIRLVGYQGREKQTISHSFHPTVILDGHADSNAPMLVTKMPAYPVIIGMGYLRNHGAVLDTVGRRIYYREGWCLHHGAEHANHKID